VVVVAVVVGSGGGIPVAVVVVGSSFGIPGGQITGSALVRYSILHPKE